MKFFNLIVLFFSFSSYGVDFSIKPGKDDVNGMGYYLLEVSSGTKNKKVDIALEGNSKIAGIRYKYVFSCKWGKAEGVKISMSSSTSDGVMLVDNYYFFDDTIKNVFAKSYVILNGKVNYTPPGLDREVCSRNASVLKKDAVNGRDFIENQSVVSQ